MGRSYIETAKKRIGIDVEIIEFENKEKRKNDEWFDFDSRCLVCHKKTENLELCVT